MCVTINYAIEDKKPGAGRIVRFPGTQKIRVVLLKIDTLLGSIHGA